MEPRRAKKYEYKTFAPIRLLHLHRAADGDIYGHLENFNLDDQRCPRFVTFSYVWGPLRYARAILLDGIPFPVLENLFPLLEAICDYSSFRDDYWVWIDSICINQEDENERALQVQLMGRVYRESARTVVWLGTGTAETDRAIGFLGILPDEVVTLRLSKILHDPQTWKDLEAFFLLPWWTRVWTLQEYVIPPLVDFHCGKKKIQDKDFSEAMQGLYICSRSRVGDSNVWGTAWGRRRLRRLFVEPHVKENMSLVALMAFTGNYECTDPRDHIYSLLGLAREQDRHMVGRPTYNPRDTVEIVYRKLFLSFVEVFDSLDIICFAPLFHDPKGQGFGEDEDWPSWLPDWRVRLRPQVVPLMVSQPSRSHIGCFRPLPWPELNRNVFQLPAFSASGSRKPCVRLRQSNRILSCRGVFVDKIDGLATVLLGDDEGAYEHSNFVQSTSATNTTAHSFGIENLSIINQQPRGTINDLASEIVCSLTLDRNSRYLERPTPVSVFCGQLQKLSRLGRFVGEETEPIYRTDRLAWRWIQENKHFLVRGRTLLEICQSIRIDLHRSSSEEGLAERMSQTIGPKSMPGRKVLVTTECGHVGLAPVNAAKDDVICVLQGCSVPVVLKKDLEGESYSLLGECYLHGFMSGEAFSRVLYIKEFAIR
jgi:hypothetical protein